MHPILSLKIYAIYSFKENVNYNPTLVDIIWHEIEMTGIRIWCMRTQDAEAVGGLTKGMLYIELIYKKKNNTWGKTRQKNKSYTKTLKLTKEHIGGEDQETRITLGNWTVHSDVGQKEAWDKTYTGGWWGEVEYRGGIMRQGSKPDTKYTTQ